MSALTICIGKKNKKNKVLSLSTKIGLGNLFFKQGNAGSIPVSGTKEPKCRFYRTIGSMHPSCLGIIQVDVGGSKTPQ